MKPTGTGSSQYIAGYALGTGLTFLPLIGIPLRFAFLDIPAPLIYAGSLVLGLMVGALGAWWRTRNHQSSI